jgi:hypothetical protein
MLQTPNEPVQVETELPNLTVTPSPIIPIKKSKLPLILGITIPAILVLAIAAFVIIGQLTHKASTVSVQQLNGLSENVPTASTLNLELLSEKIENCQLKNNPTTDNAECQAYNNGTSGWYISARGDTQILYCIDSTQYCMRVDYQGIPRQWCQVTDGAIRTNVECDVKTSPYLFVTARGDTIDIECTLPNFPISTQCVYKRVVSQCRVMFNGNEVDAPCTGRPEYGAGRYETTTGDLKQIFCNVNNAPMATECAYLSDNSATVRQTCEVNYNGNTSTVDCDLKTAPNLYEATRGDAMDIICTTPGFPSAKACTYKPVVSQCRVDFNDQLVDVECEPIGTVGKYVSSRGDLRQIYCTSNNAPMATGCLYTDYNGTERQWCRMSDGSGDLECDALTTKGQYETARGDSIKINCTTQAFPLATGCAIPGDTPAPTKAPNAPVDNTPKTIADKCKIYYDDKWNYINCRYENGKFLADYYSTREGNSTQLLSTLTLSCTNIYSPEASGCKVTEAKGQNCGYQNRGYWACKSLGGNDYQLFDDTVVTCTKPGYPTALECDNK